jgi:hypothetical protein
MRDAICFTPRTTLDHQFPATKTPHALRLGFVGRLLNALMASVCADWGNCPRTNSWAFVCRRKGSAAVDAIGNF